MSRDIYQAEFDIVRVVAHFGTIAETVKALKKIGMDVKHKTIQRQRQRRYMHADMLACLILAAHAIGKPLDIEGCIKKRE